MDRAKPALIGDVAREAHVSIATVSRALRNNGRVADQTRQRVMEVADQLGYIADPHASRLRSRRSHNVGLVAPGLKWYLSRFIVGVERTLNAADYDLSLVAVETPRRQTDFLDAARNFSRRVDGLLLVDFPRYDSHDHRLERLGRPTVTVGMTVPGQSSITVANREAAAQATEHLIGLGHVRIGLLTVGEPTGGEPPTSAIERRAGYEEALARAGIGLDERLIVDGGWGSESGQQGVARLLSLTTPPTAVFAIADEIALGAWAELDRRGLRVPDDLSLVGFDDHDLAATFGLTTVRQSVDKLGERAAEIVLTRISDPSLRADAEDWPIELVARRSSAPRVARSL